MADQNLLTIAFYFVLEIVLAFHHDQSIVPIVYDFHNASIYHQKSLYDQETDHLNFVHSVSNTLQKRQICF